MSISFHFMLRESLRKKNQKYINTLCLVGAVASDPDRQAKGRRFDSQIIALEGSVVPIQDKYVVISTIICSVSGSYIWSRSGSIYMYTDILLSTQIHIYILFIWVHIIFFPFTKPSYIMFTLPCVRCVK